VVLLKQGDTVYPHPWLQFILINKTANGIQILRIENNFVFLIESIWKFWGFNGFWWWDAIQFRMIFKI
jgi:hypothetical protein